jgi:hypothetical protein
MKQIVVVAKNRTGLLADIFEALAEHNVNIETIDAEAIDSSGVLILTVDRYDDALVALNRIPDISAVTEDAIVIRLKDELGALARIAKRFKNANISLRSVRILQRDDQYSLVAISTERTDEALQLVSDVIVA